MNRLYSYSSTGSVAVSRAGFGAGVGPIYLAYLRCNGTEENLLECPSVGPGAFCFHSEDAGVICKGRPPEGVWGGGRGGGGGKQLAT